MLTKRQLEDMVRCNIHSDCSKCACNDICIRDVMNHLAAQTALALAKMLRRLEWSNRIPRMNYLPVYEHHCPLCGWLEFNGHAPNCELGNMLKGWDEQDG